MSKVSAYSSLVAPTSGLELYAIDSSGNSRKIQLEDAFKLLGNAAPSSGAILTYSTTTSTHEWLKGTSGGVLTGSSFGVPQWTAGGTPGQYFKVGATAGEFGWGTPGGGSSTIHLPAAAWQPTGNPSSFASAQLAVYQSTAGVPSPRYNEWLFDATTAEYIVTTFRVPPNYTGASAPTLTLQYYSTAAVASGTAWGVRVGGLPTSGDFAAWAFGATAALSTNTVPSSAFDLGVATITLTEGSSLFAAGNFVCLALFRNAAVAGDAADGDMHVVSAELAYS